MSVRVEEVKETEEEGGPAGWDGSEVCNIAIVSYDLKHHYVSRTNWDKMERLN